MATASPSTRALVASSTLCTPLSPSEQNGLALLLEPQLLGERQILFDEGDPGDGLWLLGPGVEVSISRKADAQPWLTLKAGESVGELSLIDRSSRSATAQVTRGGPALFLANERMDRALEEGSVPAHKLLRELARLLCRRLRATNDQIVPRTAGTLPLSPKLPEGPCTPELLAQVAPFKDLPATVRLALAQKLKLISVPGVTPIFGEGDLGDAAYFLVQGEATVGRNGKTLATLTSGGMTGLVACVDKGSRSASVVTGGPAQLLKLSSGDFDVLFESSNRFAFQLVRWVTHQLSEFLRSTSALVAPHTGVQEEDPEVLPLELEILVDEDADEPLVSLTA